MRRIIGADGAHAREHEGATLLVTDRESARWHAHARIDVFGPQSLSDAARFHGILREPTGPELLAWARSTKGLPAGRPVRRDATGRRLVEDIAPRPDDAPFGDELVLCDDNLLTRIGLARLGNLFFGLTAGASQALDATHCRIGTGDGTTAAVTTDTDFSAAAGATHRQFQLVDSRAQGTGANSGVSTIVATFGTGVGNYTAGWQEWGIDGGTANGTTVTAEGVSTPGLVNHRVPGTLIVKTTAASAVFTGTITVA